MFSDSPKEKQLVVLAFDGMSYYLRERLEGIPFFTLAQLLQKALVCESRCKDTSKAVRHSIHTVDCNPSSSGDEPQEVYALGWFGRSSLNLQLVSLCNCTSTKRLKACGDDIFLQAVSLHHRLCYF
jgi:hypothetical protein